MASVCVITSGGWGTAISRMLALNGHTVTLWSFSQAEAAALSATRENAAFLPNIVIPDNIYITNDERAAVRNADFILNTTVSKYTRPVLTRFLPYIKPNQIIVNMSKGLEEDTLLRLTEVIRELFPKNPLAVLSGPSHAEEVALGMPTTCVAASADRSVAEAVRDLFMNPVFRVYVGADVVGAEMGGTLKNIIALSAGVCDGLGLGDNAKAALITRGIAEISRLGEAMGASRDTFLGLAGIGDLIVTCTSMHSRNRRAGILLGKGEPLARVLSEIGMTVEGVNTAKAALELAKKYNVEMPIVAEVNKLLFEGKSPEDTVAALMGREKTVEFK